MAKSLPKPFLLALIGFPHAEEVAIVATRRPGQHHHATTKGANGDHTDLAVVPTIIFEVDRDSLEHIRRIGKIKARSIIVQSRFEGSKVTAMLYVNPKMGVIKIMELHNRVRSRT